MKTFNLGQPVEFQRDTDFGREWESGTYIRLAWKGWHTVEAQDGERFTVPARRIRRAGAKK